MSPKPHPFIIRVWNLNVMSVHAYRLVKDDPDCAYEIGTKVYGSEEVLKILLDPKIDQQKICRDQPKTVTKSATFVVDLDSLAHPDDIKKDNFGRWNYSGSHVLYYRAEKTS